MGKYMVMHSCGHTVEHALFGKMKDREWRIERLQEQLCPDCYKAACEAKDASERAERGFVPLKGSEKQTQWADKIRLGRARDMDREDIRHSTLVLNHVEEADYEHAVEWLAEIDMASWWIDHRDDPIHMLIPAIIAHHWAECSTEAKEAKAERFLKTADCTSNTVVDVYAKDSDVCTKSDYDEKLIKFLKGLGFSWNPEDRIWQIGAATAFRSVDDAIADYANQLLNAGFPVMVAPELHESVIHATFKVVPEKWINYWKKGLIINTTEGQAVKQGVKCIPGARIYEDGSCYAPLSSRDEVIEFAKMNGFVISECAMREMDKYAKRFDVVDVAKAKLEKQAGTDVLEEILSSSRDVLDDLRDE